MSNLAQAKGIILRATKYGEGDLILQIILSTGEKLSVLARGARKSRRRFGGGVLDPTHFVQIQYKTSGSDRLAVLEEAQILDSFEGLRKDYDRMELALFFVSSLTKISQEGDMLSDTLFNLLGHGLKNLQEAPNLRAFKTTFCLKLLLQQGVLEAEVWMKPALKTQLKNWLAEGAALEFSDAQAHWAERQLQQYLQSAGTH